MDNIEVRREDSYTGEDEKIGWKTARLGYVMEYAPKWEPRHGFREIVQNWKDALVETYGLDENNFPLEVTASESNYVATVHDMRGKLLGFIKYSTEQGFVEVANFGSLPRQEILDIGHSTKRSMRNLAGGHGEGLKMAGLVMLRHGYRFHMEASEYDWNFGFDSSRKMICSFNRRKALDREGYREKNKRKFDPQTETDELKANLWEDVLVKIGGIYGQKWATKIDYATFRSWIDVSLDLDPPLRIIKTRFGDLILDEKYANVLYLKGLRLEVQPSAMDHKFGYNLYHGETSRDRQGMTNTRIQSETVARIWEEIIVGGNLDILNEYTQLLQDEKDWADVTLAEHLITANVASRIWRKFRVDDNGHRNFYFEQERAAWDVEVIRKCLKKQPVPLPRRIWVPLFRLPQVCTPRQEQIRLLKSCLPAEVTDTRYSLEVRRAMRTALDLHTKTAELELSFKAGETAGIDLLLDGTTLLVHERWLDFQKSHEEVSCPLTETTSSKDFNDELFSCDHIVSEWYGLVCNELLNQWGSDRIELEKITRSLQVKVSENLRNRPCKVEATEGNHAGAIEVSWVNGANARAIELHGLDLKCRVTLHVNEGICQGKRNDLIVPEDLSGGETLLLEDDSQRTAECGCPEQIVSQERSKIIFCNLDVEKSYFAMIASIGPRAFYSLPSETMRPKQTESQSTSSSERFCFLDVTPVDLSESDDSAMAGIEELVASSEDEMDSDSTQASISSSRASWRNARLHASENSPTSDTTTSISVQTPAAAQQSNCGHREEIRELRNTIQRLEVTMATMVTDTGDLRSQISMLRLKLTTLRELNQRAASVLDLSGSESAGGLLAQPLRNTPSPGSKRALATSEDGDSGVADSPAKRIRLEEGGRLDSTSD